MTKENIEKIHDIINEKVHGKEFWTSQMQDETIIEIENILNKLNLNSHLPQQEIVNKVTEYIISNYNSPKSYWDAWKNGTEQDPKELVKRTAYAALVNKQATCMGYEQATRMLLECCGVKTQTVLSKMAEDWREITHYASVAEICDNGETKLKIIDAERESYCRKHNLSFEEYVENSLYFLPPQYYVDNKLKNGASGPSIDEVMATNPIFVKGEKNLSQIIGGKNNETVKGE